MSSTSIAAIVFGCVSGSAALGMALRAALPVHHLSEDSRDTVKLATGLIATLAALVLGLLVASAKGSFDSRRAAVESLAADVIAFDRVLARYGPEAAPARDLFRKTVAARVAEIWPEGGPVAPGLDTTWGTDVVEAIQGELAGLSPRTPEQTWLRSRALERSEDLAHTRWGLLVQWSSAISTPFLAVLVFWLCFIFACAGLLAPPNGTVRAVLLVAALSVSATIFLILELDRPYQGLISVSGAPMRAALAQLGR
jgi:hypothetical protein